MVESPSLRRFATASSVLIAGFVVFKIALHLVVNSFFGYGYFRDELYYVTCSLQLDWGYVDHPPLIALLTATTRALFGDSLVAWRLFPALAGAGVVLLAGLMARELNGGLWAQAIAMLCALIAPVYLVVSNMLSTVPFDHFFWALCAYAVLRLLKTGDLRWWLVIGVTLGLGFQNKHNIVWLACGLVVGVLLTTERVQLRTRWPWLGALTALVIAAPHIIWQARNDWPLREFARNAATFKNIHVPPLDFMLDQVGSVHPLTLPIWLAGLYYFFRAADGRPYRLIGYGYVAPCLLLMATQSAKSDYLTPAYVPLFAAGAVVLERAFARRQWAKPALIGLLAVGGVVVVPFTLPVLPPATLAALTQRMGMDEPMEQGKTAPLPQYFADQFGWETMTATVAQVYAALPPDEQRRATILVGNYGEASALNLFGPRYGLPPATSGHNNYYLWGPPPVSHNVIITFGSRRALLDETFSRIEQVATITCDYCADEENNLPVYVAREPKQPLEAVWSRFKHYN